MSKNELLKGLTPEQIEKVKACKSSDELLELAKAEGIKLNDEQLQAVSGGSFLCGSTATMDCAFPGCDGTAECIHQYDGHKLFKCQKCGHEFWR